MPGDEVPLLPSVAIRFERSMLMLIDQLASEVGTPFQDYRNETIVALIADSPKYREVTQ